MKIKNLFKKINFREHQFDDGLFYRSSSFFKNKDGIIKNYDFKLTVFYCKCCDIIYSIEYIKDGVVYFWDKNNPIPKSDIVNFKSEMYEYKFTDTDSIIDILKNGGINV